jgi:hypothetical protein
MKAVSTGAAGGRLSSLTAEVHENSRTERIFFPVRTKKNPLALSGLIHPLGGWRRQEEL